jgi:hypothetical protein
MMEMELGLATNCDDATEMLMKVSQLVKWSRDSGFEMKELEIGKL